MGVSASSCSSGVAICAIFEPQRVRFLQAMRFQLAVSRDASVVGGGGAVCHVLSLVAAVTGNS